MMELEQNTTVIPSNVNNNGNTSPRVPVEQNISDILLNANNDSNTSPRVVIPKKVHQTPTNTPLRVDTPIILPKIHTIKYLKKGI